MRKFETSIYESYHWCTDPHIQPVKLETRREWLLETLVGSINGPMYDSFSHSQQDEDIYRVSYPTLPSTSRTRLHAARPWRKEGHHVTWPRCVNGTLNQPDQTIRHRQPDSLRLTGLFQALFLGYQLAKVPMVNPFLLLQKSVEDIGRSRIGLWMTEIGFL